MRKVHTNWTTLYIQNTIWYRYGHEFDTLYLKNNCGEKNNNSSKYKSSGGRIFNVTVVK